MGAMVPCTFFPDNFYWYCCCSVVVFSLLFAQFDITIINAGHLTNRQMLCGVCVCVRSVSPNSGWIKWMRSQNWLLLKIVQLGAWNLSISWIVWVFLLFQNCSLWAIAFFLLFHLFSLFGNINLFRLYFVCSIVVVLRLNVFLLFSSLITRVSFNFWGEMVNY